MNFLEAASTSPSPIGSTLVPLHYDQIPQQSEQFKLLLPFKIRVLKEEGEVKKKMSNNKEKKKKKNVKVSNWLWVFFFFFATL